MSLPRIKFGTYQYDLQTGELFRAGLPVRLQPQPAQVLKILIEASGQVVTRESLRNSLWGTDVHVDFDRSLNYAISQIRTALKDAADSPRYIETLPKTGYRFIAPAELEVELQPAPRPWLGRRAFAVGAGAISLGGMALGLSRLWGARSERRIAIARFDNETGDAGLDRFANDVTDSLVVSLTSKTMGDYGVIGNAAVLFTNRSFRDLKLISKELQAGLVILGQVKAGQASNPFVLAHLIRMPEQSHLEVARLSIGQAESVADAICTTFLRALKH